MAGIAIVDDPRAFSDALFEHHNMMTTGSNSGHASLSRLKRNVSETPSPLGSKVQAIDDLAEQIQRSTAATVGMGTTCRASTDHLTCAKVSAALCNVTTPMVNAVMVVVMAVMVSERLS